MSDKMGPGKEQGRGPANDAGPEASAGDDPRPLTGEPAAAMRLRAEPPRVTRLSRKALAGLGLAASLTVGGALIYALQNRPQGQGQELYSTDNRSTPDGLAGLPKDYTGVPKLGPPLPGDLGRPILNAQNGGPVPSTGVVGPDPEQQRREQELEAARTARLFASTQTRPASDATVPRATTDTMPRTDLASRGLAPEPAQPSAQDRQRAFLDQPPDKRTVSPDRVAPPASKNVLQAGAVIAAALITGIRSDLPGQITAQVTENVYDSPTGHILLVPQGTRLIGQYDNGVGFGQRRVLLVWTRLIFPDGRSIVLEREPGADAEGYAGLEDGVDYHWGELFKAAALSTVLSIGAQAGSSGQESDIMRALRQGASDSISQTGQQIVQRQLNVAPTLTIRPGFPVRVIVTRDLVLEPYGG
ncbi:MULTISPECIES: TrbI/VirB10 family protein [unclassified Mesorhizobium]|uniref:TrbI/VirB10 family protein n=1 Tax=unclassified Mesorhizobium TaxID=325217 RepID=UPI001127C2EC|nr:MULTISPECIES: TrbI/VirB10 family protein [unclassified Mesorhizobium]TPM89633.1 TrbI/VirB10 family protein [Mesorhizobium sp. B2-1-5]TPN31901.1 TrbI/VirB10 family protein [Mesorhizobium sp. B1-1-6]